MAISSRSFAIRWGRVRASCLASCTAIRGSSRSASRKGPTPLAAPICAQIRKQTTLQHPGGRRATSPMLSSVACFTNNGKHYSMHTPPPAQFHRGAAANLNTVWLVFCLQSVSFHYQCSKCWACLSVSVCVCVSSGMQTHVVMSGVWGGALLGLVFWNAKKKNFFLFFQMSGS